MEFFFETRNIANQQSVACRYGWHGCKWIETLKNLPFFQVFRLRVQKSSRNLLWLGLSDKIHLISSSQL